MTTNYEYKVGGSLGENAPSYVVRQAEDLGIAASTISNFVNFKPVDRRYFVQICEKLSLNWRDYAALPNQLDPEELQPAPQNPLSFTKVEYPEGQMSVDSPFYIERPPIEQRCYEEISKPGSLIRIKAPRQMGKSSLLAKIRHRAEQQGDRTVLALL